MTERETDQKRKRFEVKTYSVPFPIEGIKENIIITVTNNTPSKYSKEQIINQALKFHSEGNYSEAIKYYQYFINQGFKDHRVFSNLGAIFNEIGKLKEAEKLLLKAISLKPGSAILNTNLGGILKDLKKLNEAEVFTRRALDIDPKYAIANLNLGIILSDLGKSEEAEIYVRKAIQIKSNLDEAHSVLGNILMAVGKYQEAELSTRNAISLEPDKADYHYNLGNILNLSGKVKDARISLMKAIKINPNFTSAYINLAAILINTGEIKEAELLISKAIQIKPDLEEAYYNLGYILNKSEDIEKSINTYKKCLEFNPNDLSLNFSANIYLPEIILDNDQINLERKNYNDKILRLKSNKKLIFNENRIFPTKSFFLAYHNRYDDKLILENLSKTLSQFPGIVNLSFNKKKQIESINLRNKFRLAICSEFLRNHTIGNFFENIIKDFIKAGLEVIIIRPPFSKIDNVSKRIDSFVSESIVLPNSLQAGCEIILKKSIDILFYPDIGMSNYTYFLSLSRLALVQVTSFGHPNTSGSPNIDYFISAKDTETEDSDKYYSERLIRFSRLPFNQSQPKLTKSIFKRSELNIPNEAFLMGIPQSLFKLHPEYDYVLEKILKEIPNSFILLIESTNKTQTEKLKNRWMKNTRTLLKRSFFSPRVDRNHFLSIIKNVDIMLDPIYFGTGNTFYESMALGTPVVTMPTCLQRTRNVVAGYKQMGIKNPPVANSIEEYIEFCKKFAFMKEYKKNIVEQINKKAKLYLFNDKTIYEEYIEFFECSIESAKNEMILPKNWMPKVSNF